MKKEFLELKTLKTAMTALSEGLSIMALEKVDSLYANSRQAMCCRYQLRNGEKSCARRPPENVAIPAD